LICRSIHEVKLISRGLRSVIQIVLTTMLGPPGRRPGSGALLPAGNDHDAPAGQGGRTKAPGGDEDNIPDGMRIGSLRLTGKY
jgi:hypothetical protein